MSDEDSIKDLTDALKKDADSARRQPCLCSDPSPDGDACSTCGGFLSPQEAPRDSDEDELERQGEEVGESYDPKEPAFKPGPRLSTHARIRSHKILCSALHEYAQLAIAMDRDLARGNPSSLRVTMVKSAMGSARETTASLVASKFNDLLVESGLFAADEEPPAEASGEYDQADAPCSSERKAYHVATAACSLVWGGEHGWERDEVGEHDLADALLQYVRKLKKQNAACGDTRGS